MKSIIKFCCEENPQATMQARKDFARITGQEAVAAPYWFENTQNGERYYGVYGSIGWPGKMQGHIFMTAGYAAIVGVLKRDGEDPEKAPFKILEEIENKTVDGLIRQCFKIRGKWGFGLHPDLLPFWFGDHDGPYELIVAKVNTQLVEKHREDQAFILSPPDDFGQDQTFDTYLQELRAVVETNRKRLLVGDANILKKRFSRFERDDPCITAIGGLMHTLLIREPWLTQTTPSVWQMPEF